MAASAPDAAGNWPAAWVGWQKDHNDRLELVDALAKQAAEQVRATKEARDLIKSGREAVRHAACNLGQITFAANNHRVERLGEDGKMHTETLRDSQDAPKKKHAANAEAVSTVPKTVVVKAVKRKKAMKPLDLRCPAPPCKKRLTEARYRAARAEAERAALKRNLEHRASLLTQSTTDSDPPKMEQFRKRVRLRIKEGQNEQV